MEERKMEEYKGYNLGWTKPYVMVKVTAKGQGRVPKALGGLFTSMGNAEKAIDQYLNSLKKGRVNESAKKTKGTSTG